MAAEQTISDVSSDAPKTLKPYLSQLTFGFFNATAYMISLGTPMVLLASELGASAFEVGIIYAFVFLLLPIQILATSTLPLFGYKKQMVFAWSFRACFLVIPLWITWHAPVKPSHGIVLVFIAHAFLYSFARSLGSCAVMPWFYARLPDEIRGRYFATDQSVNGAAGILTLLFCATLFSILPPFSAFFYQYLFATVCSGLSVFFLTRIPSVPKPEKTTLKEIILETPKLYSTASPFRQFLVFMIAYNILGASFVPFTTYFLKVEVNISSHEIMILTAVQYAGAIISSFFTRNRIDSLGVKPIIRFSLLLNIGIMIFWFVYVSGIYDLRQFLPLAYLAFGISISSWIASGLKYLPRVCSESRQALHVSIHSATVGLIAGLSPIVWGLLIKSQGREPGINRFAFSGFFILIVVVLFCLFLYVPKLTSHNRERSSILTTSPLLRPFRYFSFMVNFIPSISRQTSPEESKDETK